MDVAEATAVYHVSALNRARPLHDRRIDTISADDIAELVAALVAQDKKRETIRKTVTVLSMVFDHASSEASGTRPATTG